jgi:multidrug resistance efflux pump
MCVRYCVAQRRCVVKKIVLGLIPIVLVLILLSLAGCGGTGASTQPTPTAASSANAVKASGKIVAEGKVVPVRSAALAFQTGGIIAELPIALGDAVETNKLLARLDTRQLELQLAQSEANLASAQAKLNQLKRGPIPEELASAQQSLTSAQAAYDNLMHPPVTDIVALKTDVDKAKAQLDRASAAYDRIGGDSNPYSNMSAERAQLQSASLDYQKALTLYDAKINPTNAQIQQAQASIQTAKNTLAKLQPTVEDIAAAQANVNAAQAARDLNTEQIRAARLSAPFAGRVTSLDFKNGEFAAAGATILRLADTNNFQVETTDLTELNIVNVHEGDAVTITLDAIPDLNLAGKVTQIKGYGENKQGDIVYTLVITLDKQDPRLKWNMTAKVSIEPKK